LTFRTARLAIALTFASTAAASAAQSLYTATRGTACKDASKAYFSVRRCPGPAGYAAEYADEGNVAAVALWIPGPTSRRAAASVVWRGGGRVFGDLLEWRLDGENPVAAILRIWRIDDARLAGGNEAQEELVLLKVRAEGSCRVATVSARRPNANEVVRTMSSRVGSMSCLDDDR
jgi:hypothetical protein